MSTSTALLVFNKTACLLLAMLLVIVYPTIAIQLDKILRLHA
ncbi:hypothetical protein [Rivularia sp. UHCC 0363]|nr:hypothetical protein [Rivularia sp. UHCC 0363]MEA5594332.1 hypothetical protein [Rivularia sp. UHCC 0363]